MGHFGIFLCFLVAGHVGLSMAGFTNFCLLAVDVGSCQGYFPKWFYNSTSARCEQFIYGGCQGNLNRFDSRESCEDSCICDRCTLQPETGPCRARVPSYFYNTTSGNCEQFIYGGCEGNNNRFQTAAECTVYCSNNSSCPVKGQTVGSCPSCQGTCDNPAVPCPLSCTGDGCVCPPGQLIDTEANECVHPSQCPVKCSEVECPEINCVNGNATIPPGSCCPVCVCDTGHLPGEAFNADCNVCLCTSTGLSLCTLIACEATESPTPPSNKKSCPIEGQEYTECGTACPITCQNLYPAPCVPECVPGCQCPKGTVLDEENNKCVEHCTIPPCERVMCSLQPDTGPCKASSFRYYWNINTRQCERFLYGGCGGNYNTFLDVISCANQCACKDVSCKEGSWCRVHEPTGQPYCEPSCYLNNGGCPADQTCSLRNVTCVQQPCPQVVECKECLIEGQVYTDCGTACPPMCNKPQPQPLFCTRKCVPGCQCPSGTVLDELQNKCVKADECTPCPPVCSYEFCSKKRNRKKPCSRPPPHSTSGCPNQCHSTYCNACYYSETPRSSPKQCKKRVCANELVTADCLKRWAKCVGRKDRKYNKCTDDCRTAKNFRCYDYPPCLQG